MRSDIATHQSSSTAERSTAPTDRVLNRIVIASVAGNPMEWYDFFVYCTAAALVLYAAWRLFGVGGGFVLSSAAFLAVHPESRDFENAKQSGKTSHMPVLTGELSSTEVRYSGVALGHDVASIFAGRPLPAHRHGIVGALPRVLASCSVSSRVRSRCGRDAQVHARTRHRQVLFNSTPSIRPLSTARTLRHDIVGFIVVVAKVVKLISLMPERLFNLFLLFIA